VFLIFETRSERALLNPTKYPSGTRKMRSTAVRSYVGDPT
jgi:hypothetical protein